ncbi:MAG: FecR domain-containing protein [Oligoflexia bacterium]|nr:FecR domain-containing protein [Oligoflexia bacterium]
MKTRSEFKFWEIALLILAILLLLASAAVYFTGFPLASYIFGLSDDSHGYSIGRVVRRDGSLKREKSGATAFEVVSQGDTLYSKDMIVTGSDAKATVSLEDGSTIELAPNTMIRLEMEQRHDVSGIVRVNHVQVVSGEVKSIASSANEKSKLIIRSQDKEIEGSGVIHASTAKPMKAGKLPVVDNRPVAEPSQRPLPVPFRPSPTPSPAPSPRPSPSPSPSPKPEPAQPAIAIVSPQSQSVITVPKGSLEPVAMVDIKLELSKYGRKIARKNNLNASVRIYREEGPQPVAQQNLSIGATPVGLIFKARLPGRYRIEAQRGDLSAPLPANLVTRTSFTVPAEYEGIKLHQAESKSEKISDDEPRRFVGHLSWEPYPGVSGYHLHLSRPNRPTEDIQVSGTDYNVVRESISDQARTYEVSANLPNGWIVKSPGDRLMFEFIPPSPVSPADGTLLADKNNLWDESGVLISWQKTGISEAYVFEISEDPEFKQMIVNRRQKDNFLVFKPANRDVIYFWRVRAVAGESVSNPSQTFRFRVKQRVLPAATATPH